MRDPVQRNVPPRPGGGGGEAPGPGRKAGQADATGTMSIGEVLGILKPEFPDITVSKIRFLEGAGLVQPDRSASGYRKFSEDDVARLRFVLRAQRDQYLPLRVIRQRLADLEQVGDLDAKGGLMVRAERVVLLCLGLLFESLLVPVLWVMLALTAITAVQRFVKVWRQAQVAPVTAARIELRRSRRQSRRVARTERRRTRVPRRRP